MNEKDYVKAIQNLELGNKEESYKLYMNFCEFLKEKYGLVNKNYDENPTKRGDEWLDIHHIKEYELDNISNRTTLAKRIENSVAKQTILLQIKTSGEKYYSLTDLKPYNEKSQLVYANKIEHFLLHYLIDSLRGKKELSYGSSKLWDSSVALELYGFYQIQLIRLQEKKESFYSTIDVLQITKLYKKLIDWKNWNINDLSLYWYSYISIIDHITWDSVSNVRDKRLFFKLMKILDFKIPTELKQQVETLPYLGRIVNTPLGDYLRINRIDFSLDGKVACRFLTDSKESYKVPENVREIGDAAFFFELKKVTIPLSVEKMGDRVFCLAEGLEVINYLGTKEMWDEKFSNVSIGEARLICKKNQENFHIIQCDSNGLELNRFDSIADAQEFLGMPRNKKSSIYDCFRKNSKKSQAYGYIWKKG